MGRARYVVAVSLISIAVLVPCVVRASSVLALSEPELVARADTIVVGSVVQIETLATEQNRIVRHVLLQVHRGLRGASEGDVVTLEVPGGQLGNIVSSVDGAPVFVPGQMVIAFMVTRGAVRRPLGLSYGVYNIISDSSGRWQTVRDLHGLALFDSHGHHLAAVPGGAMPQALSEVLQRVSEEIRVVTGER